MTDKTRTNFEAHCEKDDPAYRPSDEGFLNRRDWAIWQAATLAAAPQWLPIADAPESPIELLALSQMGRVSVQTGWALLNMLADAKDNGEECIYKGWLPLPPTATPQGNPS